MSLVGLVRRRRRIAGLGAVLAALGLVALAAFLLRPARYLDGEGPLASVGDPSSRIVEAFDQGTTGPWTLGVQLCVATGDGVVTIESVSPTKTVGSGYRYLGALVRQFEPAPDHSPIGSVLGYPPRLPDQLHPVQGYEVVTPCSQRLVHYTELLLGFAGRGSDGGGWLGVDVAYIKDGRHQTVQLGYVFVVCGPAIPDQSMCHPPSGSPVGARTTEARY